MGNPKQKLTNALQEAGVEFPPSATTQQLRNLLQSVVGVGANIIASAPGNATDSDETSDAFDVDANNAADAANISGANTAVADPSITNATLTADAGNIVDANAADATNIADVNTAIADSSITNATLTADAANINNTPENAATAATGTTINSARGQRAIPSIGDLDKEVVALKKRLEILTLIKRIEDLEGRVPIKNKQILDFGDNEHALPKFNGDDVSSSVLNFLRYFEEIMDSLGADDRFKLLALRSSLTGTARVFLSTTTALNYDTLKKALTAEFDKAITRQEIYRKWKRKDEPIHCYILHIQALAKRANIAETELIDFIIDGMGNSVPNIQLLMTARTLDELKTLVVATNKNLLRPTSLELLPSSPSQQT
ncbi:uncharacterized protein [Eurosta solidaginis]|uniref:uncharacterized protein n=1 Tax=Eurosta solidaginis TaxID=178769 RepID=UPI003531542C